MLRTSHTPIQTAASLVGAVFLLVGIVGFIPGLTTNYDDLSVVGHHGASLLGLFQVNVLHNIVHLAFGVAGLLLAVRFAWARLYLLAGGAIYLVLVLYGALVDRASGANFVALNVADNWLHLGLGVAMVGLGLALGQAAARRPGGVAPGRAR